MKNVIIDKALFSEVLRINVEYDSFCTVLNCSLVKLHENAELYACVRSTEGIPCKLYIANSSESVDKSRAESHETEWIEAIGNRETVTIRLCHKTAQGSIEKVRVSLGTQTPTIAKSLCRSMDRLSTDRNNISIICHKKKYGEAEKAAFQKRSVVDLSEIDSSGVDIIYFDGADKLIEKLLYGGCRELTVFVTEAGKSKSVLKLLDKLSRRAPFSNRITVVTGATYAPKTTSTLLVGKASDLAANALAKVFFSVNYAEHEGVGVSVGQNTVALIPDESDHRLKPHTLHYITSIMSELILRAITTKEYRAKRLFKVNAKNLITETIIKEN